MRNAIIMGRKTWESIPMKFRPLKDRVNIILSKTLSFKDDEGLSEDVYINRSLEEALYTANHVVSSIDQVFVIGGATIYKQAIESVLCKHIYFTEVDVLDPKTIEDMDCFFPNISAFQYHLLHRSAPVEEPGYRYRYLEFERNDDIIEPRPKIAKLESTSITASINMAQSNEEEKSSVVSTSNLEENQYLEIVRDILANGNIRGDRTGTGTISKFGVQMRFSLRNNRFPLLTTKKVFWRGVAEELIWFIHGSTNANELKNKGIHIWDGNGSREYLDKLGLVDRVEGDLGPVYGFQWRHFGAKVIHPP